MSFLSTSTNLVSPPLTGTLQHVYVRDRQGQTTIRAPESSAAFASLSADGRYAVLHTNTAVWVRDRFAGVSTVIASGGVWPRISGDGRYVVYLDDVSNQLVVKPSPL